MNFLRSLAVGAFFVTLWATGCKPTNTTREPAILKINDSPIPLSEFKFVYEKSITSPDSLYMRKSVVDYLELFTNFKLRVAEAKRLGMDTVSSFLQEYRTYQDQLAQPYLANPRFIDSLTREAYNRMKTEVSASHILINVGEEANPADTLTAYKKLQAIRERAVKGEDFGQLALENSQDPSAKQNKGALGYFSAMQMVYEFETQAYLTPIGQISPIFRTNFGYHILKTHDKRAATGTLSVAHIMTQVPQKSNPDEINQAFKRLEEVYNRLQRGENWDELCKKYSDDSPTKGKGGVLPEFKVGEVLPEFEANVLSLKNSGEYTKPFRSSYGFHIVKLLERKGLPAFSEVEPTLRNEVQKDSRSKLSKAVLVKQILKDNQFKEVPESVKGAIASADARLPQGAWSYDVKNPVINKPLFSLYNKEAKTKQNFIVKDFFNFVYEKQLPKQGITDAQYVMQMYYEKFKEEVALSLERTLLSKKYPDYRLLLNEYREGILYFELMREKVWNKAIEDTLGAKNYFEQNRDKYRWDTRVNATMYQVANEQTLAQLKNYLSKTIFPVYHIKSDPIYFDNEKHTHTESALNTLNILINTMKKNPDLVVEIASHTDEKESRLVAMERIRATVSYLNFKGIADNRISTKEFGSTKLITKENAERFKNRRVEFTFFSSSKKQLEKILNETNPLNLKVTEGVFSKGDNEVIDKVTWKSGFYETTHNGQLFYVDIQDIKEPRQKAYEEARGYVINDYQKYLEKQWIAELRQKYKVEIDQKEVDKLIKK
jgi:peptidyl-prolyl cis-trans isomerase SurA